MMGKLIWNSEKTSDRRFVWDVKSKAGSEVLNGVYIYILKAEDSKKLASGKIVIIR
jgi:hypothetical protein